LLWLINEIIDSAKQLAGERVNGLASESANWLTDSQANYSIGLPIGNLTSQFFANLYLDELDYFAKFGLCCRYYIRYMDDFLIFENSKQTLQKLKQEIRGFLKNMLNLEMHEGKSQIYKTKKGIKFLGFVLFKDHRRLTSDNVRRFKKRLKRFDYLLNKKEIGLEKVNDSVRAWVAHSKYANTKRLRFNIWRRLVKKKGKLMGMPSYIISENQCCYSYDEQNDGHYHSLAPFKITSPPIKNRRAQIRPSISTKAKEYYIWRDVSRGKLVVRKYASERMAS